MPRIGQLLSALLVALIGVLVVQMFFIAGVQQRLEATQPVPATDIVELPAPVVTSALAAPPVTAAIAPPAATTLVIVIAAGDGISVPPSPATEIQASSAPHDRGRTLINNFIELTDAPHGTAPFTQEVAS